MSLTGNIRAAAEALRRYGLQPMLVELSATDHEVFEKEMVKLVDSKWSAKHTKGFAVFSGLEVHKSGRASAVVGSMRGQDPIATRRKMLIPPAITITGRKP